MLPPMDAGLRARGERSLDRALAFTGFAVALIALAGYSSGRSAWNASAHGAGVPHTAVAVVAAVAGVAVAAGLLVMWAGTPGALRRRRRSRPEATGLDEAPASLWSGARVTLVVIGSVLLVCAALWPLMTANRTQIPSLSERASPLPGQKRVGAVTKADGSSPAVWLLVGAVGALVLLGPIALVFRRRARHAGSPPPDIEQQLAGAIAHSLSELESVADPREAIRRAYGRMEGALASVEFLRARDETPTEFLPRVEHRVATGGAAASVLTDLYELAQFSAHALDERDRRAAIGSLRRLEAEIARGR